MYSTIRSSEESHPPSRPLPRPWSPDPRDPVPSLRYSGGHQHQRHEVSDPSIEAFDLADYARTLNRNPYEYPYDDYLSSPPPTRSFSLASHSSSQPPSLVSSRGTPTSYSQSTPSHRYTPSIPVQSPARTSVYNLPGGVPYSHEPLRRPPNAVSSHDVTVTSEIDIAHFPSWSHGWYANEKKWSPIGQLHEPSRASFFDPTYPTAGKTGNRYDGYATASNLSSRDFVPWSDSDSPMDYDSPLDPELKQERVRMLEHEFGSTAADTIMQEQIGSVNGKGRLITDGPKKRTAIRALEVLLALGIATVIIYAALWIKPPKSPPPQSKPQTFALYALSILTALFCLYFFFFRPCCCGGRKTRNVTGSSPSGLAVLPIQELQGNKKKKKGKKGKQEQGNVQVNLIVDPTMFGPRVGQDDEESANPEDHLSSSSQSGSGKPPKRRSVFEGLALEEQWKQARRDLKLMLFYDSVGLLLWSVEFLWILIRERCPPGGFNGWCNTYNVASAGSCLLGIAFGISVFFDVKDLHQSRISPRTRT